MQSEKSRKRNLRHKPLNDRDIKEVDELIDYARHDDSKPYHNLW